MKPLRFFAVGFALLLLVGSGFLDAQQPPGLLPASIRNSETQEPPKADASDDGDTIKQTGLQTPANGQIPVGPSSGAPAGFTQVPTPSVSISIDGPPSVHKAAAEQKEKDIRYVVTVRNSSAAAAFQVEVIAPLPKGVASGKFKFSDGEETKDLLADGKIPIGTLKAGAVKQIELTLTPKPEATQIKLVARVQFEHGVVIMTKLENARLKVAHSIASKQVVKGVPFAARLQVTNQSSITIKDIVVDDKLDQGLELDSEQTASPKPLKISANTLTWKIDSLRPGETRTIDYRLVSNVPGKLKNSYSIEAHGIKRPEPWDVDVREANMSVVFQGPTTPEVLLQSPARYAVSVKNTGDAELSNVVVNCSLPKDVKATRTSSGSQIYPDSVQWVIPILKPNEEKVARVTLEGSKAGPRAIQLSAHANPGLSKQQTYETTFYGQPTLDWKSEGGGTSAIGDTIPYTVTVSNRGDGPAKRVYLKVELPPEVEFIEATPHSAKEIKNGIAFEPIDIPAKEGDKPDSTKVFKFSVRAKTAGEAVFKFDLLADHYQEPLHQEKVTNITGKGTGTTGK